MLGLIIQQKKIVSNVVQKGVLNYKSEMYRVKAKEYNLRTKYN